MKLSISNIGWPASLDQAVYGKMVEYGFTGLEIAPTRIFPLSPYRQLEKASRWSQELKHTYGISISSMQSIWYGRQEKLFGSPEERAALLEYTKEAIDFASAMGCGNLVFGCPKNRTVPAGLSPDAVDAIALPFFKELGDYAASKGTVLALEANPPLYHTNYINHTSAALELIKKVGSPGFLLNLDVGTMIACGESPSLLEGSVPLIHHVHLSEPGLPPLEERPLHRQLAELLAAQEYQGYLSIEVGTQDCVETIERLLHYGKGCVPA